MAIAGFEQDPQGMPGMGWVSDEFGNRRYLFAPQLAGGMGGGGIQAPQIQAPQQPAPFLMDMAQKPPDARIAQGPPNQLAQPTATDASATPPNAATAANAAMGAGQPQNLPEAIGNMAMTNVGKAMLQEQNQPVRQIPAGYTPSKKEEEVSKQGRPLEEGELAGIEARGQQREQTRVEQGQSEFAAQHARASALMEQALSGKTGAYAAVEAQKRKQADIDHHITALSGEMDQHLDDARTAEKNFDPNRLFSGVGGTLAGIGAAIFRAMGAYAQMKGRAPNNAAADVIDAAIQRDIEQQKMQIQSSRGQADNALKRLTLLRGDKEQAEKELSAYQHAWAEGRLQAAAAATGLPQIQTAMEKDITDIRAKTQQEKDAAKDRAFGVISAKVEQKYKPAQTVGGPPSLDKQLERAGKVASIEKTYADAAKERAGKGPDVAKYGEEIDKIDQADRALRKFVTVAGGTVADNGQVTFKNGTKLRRNPLTGDVSELTSNNDQSVALNQAALALGHLQAGARLPAEMLGTYRNSIVGRDDDAAQLAITMRLQELESRKRDLQKRFGPQAAQVYRAGGAGAEGAESNFTQGDE